MNIAMILAAVVVAQTSLADLGGGERMALRVAATVDADTSLERARLEVRGEGGRVIQTLRVRGKIGWDQFLTNARLLDVDFDGYADLLLLREFGAKWGEYDVWRWSPEAHRFVETAWTRALGALPNLTVDRERHRLISYDIGPNEPSEDLFVVRNGRLIHTATCHAERSPACESWRRGVDDARGAIDWNVSR